MKTNMLSSKDKKRKRDESNESEEKEENIKKARKSSEEEEEEKKEDIEPNKSNIHFIIFRQTLAGDNKYRVCHFVIDGRNINKHHVISTISIIKTNAENVHDPLLRQAFMEAIWYFMNHEGCDNCDFGKEIYVGDGDKTCSVMLQRLQIVTYGPFYEQMIKILKKTAPEAKTLELLKNNAAMIHIINLREQDNVWFK